MKKIYLQVSLLLIMLFVLGGCTAFKKVDRRTRSRKKKEFVVKCEAHNSIWMASWNIEGFGEGEKDLDKIVEIIGRYDLVAMQGISEAAVIDEVVALLDKNSGAEWARLITDQPVGGSDRAGYYAVVYRLDRLVSNDDPRLHKEEFDEFEREPFITSFLADKFSFRLININVTKKLSRAKRELSIVQKVIENELGANEGDDDVIVAGSFNREPSAKDWADLRGFGYRPVIDAPNLSFIGEDGLSRLYGNFVVGRTTGENVCVTPKKEPEIEIYNFLTDYGDDVSVAKERIGENLPVALRFRTDIDPVD